jgi:hypothetical protein
MVAMFYLILEGFLTYVTIVNVSLVTRSQNRHPSLVFLKKSL